MSCAALSRCLNLANRHIEWMQWLLGDGVRAKWRSPTFAMRLAFLISNRYRRLQLTTSHPMQSCSGQRMFSVFVVVFDSSFVFSSRHMFCDFLFFWLGVHSFLSFWLLSSINKRKKIYFIFSPLEKLNEFCFRFDFLFFCSIARKEVFFTWWDERAFAISSKYFIC